MLPNIAGNSYLILAVLVFIAVLLLAEALYLIWKTYKGPEARKIESRLRALSGSLDHSKQARVLKERMLSEVPALQRLLLNLPRAQRLDRFILQAGLDWTVSRLLVTCWALGVIAFMAMIGLAHQPLSAALLAGVAVGAIPLGYVHSLRQRRLGRLERQLPDALDLVTRALRSGHAFASGLQMIGDEMAEPIAGEFRIVHDEVNFGVSLQQALNNLSERVPVTDLRYFVVAVLIQRESGGNLTEVLANLSRLIRERLKLLSRIRVLSSEGRLSAWVLGVMPFGLAGGMYLVNPEFMSPLWTDPIGLTIIKYTMSMMAIGILVLRRIVRIRV